MFLRGEEDRHFYEAIRLLAPRLYTSCLELYRGLTVGATKVTREDVVHRLSAASMFAVRLGENLRLTSIPLNLSLRT